MKNIEELKKDPNLKSQLVKTEDGYIIQLFRLNP